MLLGAGLRGGLEPAELGRERSLNGMPVRLSREASQLRLVTTAATFGISPTVDSPSDVVIELGIANVVVVLLVVVMSELLEDITL